MAEIKIGDRWIGEKNTPFVIAEIGINHEGDFEKAKEMVKDAYESGAECVKIQSHVVEDEMIPNEIIPGNSKETIWDIMSRCALNEEEEKNLKKYTEELGMTFLSTPFSRAAANRLERLGVSAYKIGSGECNNYPLIEHIASFGKPVILSTGMNDLQSIAKSVDILERYGVSYALLHCTSMYPTPYKQVRLGAISVLQKHFPNAVIGLSDHSLGNYTSFAAVSLGASIIEKHFTSDKNWPGPDVPISIDPLELKELIIGTDAVHQALGGSKEILPEEQATIDFAYACVVATEEIAEGEIFSEGNIWVKRPGTGEIKAEEYTKLIGKRAMRSIQKNTQIEWGMVDG